MGKRAACAFVILCCLLVPGLSFGADINGLRPPAPFGIFTTLSAQSPARGETAFSGTYEALFSSSFYRFGANLAYGLRDNVELSMSVSEQRDGFEDIAFGLKHRFIDKGSDGLSLAYLVTGSLSTGNDDVGTDGRIGGGFIMSQKVGPVFSHTNIMYAVPGDSSLEGELRLSTGIVFSAAHNLWLLGEMDVKSSHFADNIDIFETKLGYRVRVVEKVYIDVGLGVDLKRDPVEYRFMTALSFGYPFRQKVKHIYEDRQ
ncbi:MAG: hypothetical protein PVG55_03495 [Nitrospirota bacterium]|jgi:hypothetical protein